MTVIAFDGASRGNPGRGSASAVVMDDKSIFKTLVAKSPVTNNVAEFNGFILAVQIAKEQGYENVEFRGDSQLIVNLVTGKYKASNENMIKLLAVARKKLEDIPKWSIAWWPRDQNVVADRLCNECLK